MAHCTDNHLNAAMLLSPTSSEASASLMIIAQQFFQQQQQQQQYQLPQAYEAFEDPWRGVASLEQGWHSNQEAGGDAYKSDSSSYMLAAAASLAPQQVMQQTHQGGGGGGGIQCRDDEEELLRGGYFDGFSPPTPETGGGGGGGGGGNGGGFDASAANLVVGSSDNWMECFMSELQAPCAAATADAAVAPPSCEYPSESSQSSELLGYPCTPDDIWRDHFGLNLHSSCSSDQWAPTPVCDFTFPSSSSNNNNNFSSSSSSGFFHRHFQQQQQQQAEAGGDSERQVQLTQLLLTCFDDIESRQIGSASEDLRKLRAFACTSGDSIQKVASYFADGLEARLLMLQSALGEEEVEDEQGVATAYKTLHDACPYLKFAHLTANQALLEATDGARKIHIVDYGTMQGVQWAALIQAFATWPSSSSSSSSSSSPRSLRITGIPSPELGSDPASAMITTGRRLTEFAQLLNVDFEFCPILERLEDIDASMLRIEADEVVAVNFVLQLAQLSADALTRAFSLLHRLNPSIITVAEYETNNGCNVREQMISNARFYCSVFESIDVTMPRDDPARIQAEKLFFAQEIKKSLLMRDSTERNEHWQRCIDSAGLWSAPLSHYTTSQARLLLWLYNSDNFTLTEGPGCLSLGWLGRSIVTVSAWHC